MDRQTASEFCQTACDAAASASAEQRALCPGPIMKGVVALQEGPGNDSMAARYHCGLLPGVVTLIEVGE